MSLPNSFVRSKIKNTAHFAALLAKIEALQAKKQNAFNVYYGSDRLMGVDMTALDLTTDPTKVTFTHGGVDYEFLLTDIKIVKRIRTRKYVFVVNVLTIVV